MKKIAISLIFLCFAGIGWAHSGDTLRMSRIFADEGQSWLMEQIFLYDRKVDFSMIGEENYRIELLIDEYFGRDSVKSLWQIKAENPRKVGEERRSIHRGLFMVQQKDTAVVFSLSFPGAVSGRGTFRLYPVDEGVYSYEFRPFEESPFAEGVKIPLGMFGSSWKDGKVYRMCGSSRLPADLENKMFEQSPHYFIVSIRFTKLPPD